VNDELKQALEGMFGDLKETITKAISEAAPVAKATEESKADAHQIDAASIAEVVTKAVVAGIGAALKPIHEAFEEELTEVARGVDTLAETVDKLVEATAVKKSIAGQDNDDDDDESVVKSKFGRAFRSLSETGGVVLS